MPNQSKRREGEAGGGDDIAAGGEGKAGPLPPVSPPPALPCLAGFFFDMRYFPAAGLTVGFTEPNRRNASARTASARALSPNIAQVSAAIS